MPSYNESIFDMFTEEQIEELTYDMNELIGRIYGIIEDDVVNDSPYTKEKQEWIKDALQLKRKLDIWKSPVSKVMLKGQK